MLTAVTRKGVRASGLRFASAQTPMLDVMMTSTMSRRSAEKMKPSLSCESSKIKLQSTKYKQQLTNLLAIVSTLHESAELVYNMASIYNMVGKITVVKTGVRGPDWLGRIGVPPPVTSH